MPNNPCDAWGDLLWSKNRGQIYDYFDHNRKDLVEHLQHCDICGNMLASVLPAIINQLDSKTPQEFADIIRATYNNAQGMSFGDEEITKDEDEDDSVNTDHD